MERAEVRNHLQQQQQGVGGCRAHPEQDFLLQWGNRKRLRCVKIQVKDDATEKTSVRVDRRVVGPDKEPNLLPRRPSHHRILRSSEAMKGQNNGVRTSYSPERRGGCEGEVKGYGAHDTAQDKKGGCGGGSSSSSGGDATVWPKFTIGLTNKEKEEDFMAIKGSKLPQRPKKRAKFVQRTLNEGKDWLLPLTPAPWLVVGALWAHHDLVSPGLWLCDLSLERYEVREKKICKKRPRGLKAMGSMESDSEE